MSIKLRFIIASFLLLTQIHCPQSGLERIAADPDLFSRIMNNLQYSDTDLDIKYALRAREVGATMAASKSLKKGIKKVGEISEALRQHKIREILGPPNRDVKTALARRQPLKISNRERPKNHSKKRKMTIKDRTKREVLRKKAPMPPVRLLRVWPLQPQYR